MAVMGCTLDEADCLILTAEKTPQWGKNLIIKTYTGKKE